MVVGVEWDLWNGISGMAGMEWLSWKPEGWKCLVYRKVRTPHPWEIRIFLRDEYSHDYGTTSLLFIFFAPKSTGLE